MTYRWTPGTTLRDIETEVLEQALAYYQNKTKAAEALGISVRTLRVRIQTVDRLGRWAQKYGDRAFSEKKA